MRVPAVLLQLISRFEAGLVAVAMLALAVVLAWVER